MPPHSVSARTKILDAALALFRRHGYAATSVDALCSAAGVTKGAFFHHFASKEELAVAAARYWSEMTSGLFAAAHYHREPTARDRVLAYIDFRKALITGEAPEFTCLAGTLVQETFAESQSIRDACADSICSHAATLVPDRSAAMVESRGDAGPFDARSLALFTQAVLQGAFILAKATNEPQVARDCVDHLHRYLGMLLDQSFEPTGEPGHD